MSEYELKSFRAFPKHFKCFDCLHFKCMAIRGGCSLVFFYECSCGACCFDKFVSVDMKLCPALDFEKCFDFLQKKS